MYQTLDAIDGKQARNTKASSPLGQLFDHGCDSFSTTFLVLTIAQAFQLGSHINTLILIGIVQFGFFLFQWKEHHTHVLLTQFGAFGTTEGELLVMWAVSLGAWPGQAFMQAPIQSLLPTFLGTAGFWSSLPTITPVQILVYSSFIGLPIGILLLIQDTLKKTPNKTKALAHFLPIAILFIGANVWARTDIFTRYPAYFLLSYGCVFSIVTARMIVCSLCKMKFPVVQLDTVFVLLSGIAFYFGERQYSGKVMQMVFFAYIITTFAIELLWVRGVIGQITNHLGLYIFKIGKRPKAQLPAPTTTGMDSKVRN